MSMKIQHFQREFSKSVLTSPLSMMLIPASNLFSISCTMSINRIHSIANVVSGLPVLAADM